MTDVETLLRSRLHEQLDDLQPSTLTTQHALRAGQRARRRRTAFVAGTTALVLLAGGATAGALLRGGTDTRDSVIAGGVLTDRTVAYAEQFRAGDFASIRSDMSARTRTALSEGALRAAWRDIVTAYGPASGPGAPVVENRRPTTVLVPLHFRDGDVSLRVTYDAQARVIGVTLLTGDAKRLPDVPRALETVALDVVADLANGRYEDVRDRFDALMTRKLTAAELGRGWQALAVDKHGGFRSTGGVTATESSGYIVVDVFCTMRRGELKVRISFDELGRISGLFLLEP